jgi:hypothetical protein
MGGLFSPVTVNAALVLAFGELTREVDRRAKAAYTGCSTR